MARYLVTGTAGFIGFHTAKKLLHEGHSVVGIDNINDYYDVRLKYDRLSVCGISESEIQPGKPVKSTLFPDYQFLKINLEDKESLEKLFNSQSFDYVIHLAAQAGVRYSLTHPDAYVRSNITGFLNILEGCRYYPVKHLVYASSSSVYGLNTQMPFSVRDNVDHPLSLYAASKKSNELMAHTYSHLIGIPTSGLRFFTVYGPWGRPDMALFIFTKAILEGKPVELFNNGNMMRDFTYIDDIVEAVLKVAINPPEGNLHWDARNPDPSTSPAPYRIFNIGNNHPVRLMDFVSAIENALNIKAKIKFLPIQPGDVPVTWADVSDLIEAIAYSPKTPVDVGIHNFVNWFRRYYNL